MDNHNDISALDSTNQIPLACKMLRICEDRIPVSGRFRTYAMARSMSRIRCHSSNRIADLQAFTCSGGSSKTCSLQSDATPGGLDHRLSGLTNVPAMFSRNRETCVQLYLEQGQVSGHAI